MHRKGAQDKKKAKVFTKLAREIIVAAKSGSPDISTNFKLRTAILAARAVNMPKDKIEATIKKATSSGDAENYEEMRYEGYAPGGVAVIIDALTDNRNRTASDVRATFTKYGGALGETGSVNFMFEKVGIIQYPVAKASEDSMFEAVAEAGGEDCKSDENGHEIFTTPEKFNEVKEALSKKFGDPESARLGWRPKTTIAVDEENAVKIFKMIEALEDSDDVQQVTANFEMTDEIMKKLAM